MTMAKVTYINLDTRPDRREHIEKVLQHCPVPVERFAAIRLEDDPRNFGLKVRFDMNAPRAVASIWKSHFGVLESFVISTADGLFCLVEDDALISAEFWGELDGLIARLPDDWRMVMVSQRYRKRKRMSVNGRPRFIRFPFQTGPVLLRDQIKTYRITGAHLCIFRNQAAVGSILVELDAADVVIDIDRFYSTLPGIYGIDHAGVTAGGFDSDHN